MNENEKENKITNEASSSNFKIVDKRYLGEDGEIYEKSIVTMNPDSIYGSFINSNFGMTINKRKVRKCKKCGNEFYPERDGHNMCVACFELNKRNR